MGERTNMVKWGLGIGVRNGEGCLNIILMWIDGTMDEKSDSKKCGRWTG